MRLTVEDKKQYTVIYFSGEFDTEYEHMYLLEKVKKILTNNVKKIIFDLTEVKFLASADISTFMQANKMIIEQKGKLRICSCRPEVARVLRITKVNSIVEIYTSEDSASRNF